MKCIELTEEQYNEILECLPYISDTSYADRIAWIIKDAIPNEEYELT